MQAMRSIFCLGKKRLFEIPANGRHKPSGSNQRVSKELVKDINDHIGSFTAESSHYTGGNCPHKIFIRSDDILNCKQSTTILTTINSCHNSIIDIYSISITTLALDSRPLIRVVLVTNIRLLVQEIQHITNATEHTKSSQDRQ